MAADARSDAIRVRSVFAVESRKAAPVEGPGLFSPATLGAVVIALLLGVLIVVVVARRADR